MVRIALIAAGLLIAALAIWHPAPHPMQAVVATVRASASPRPHRSQAPSDAVVYVVGAVPRPGLYRVRPGDRVDDAVRAAGGLLASADPSGVNLAARVRDGDEVLVPLLGAAPARARRGRAARSSTRPSPPASPIDVNSADAQSLAEVPGIGPTVARRIVALREREGAFESFDELLDVAGMTASRLERAQPYLTLR